MNRLEKLKELEEEIRKLMQKANSRTFASLARQYREVLREIEEIEGGENSGGEIGDLLARRRTDGRTEAHLPGDARVPND